LGEPFEREDIDPERQCSSIPLAASQKGHTGSHRSWPAASKRGQRWRRCCRRI